MSDKFFIGDHIGSEEIETVLGYKPVKNVQLYSVGNGIYSDSDMTEELNFNQVKELVQDERNNVVLWNGNYVLRPEYTREQGTQDAIWFNGTTSLDGKVYLYRVIINSNNVVQSNEYLIDRGEWKLVGTMTSAENYLVDLTGYSEFEIISKVTATGNTNFVQIFPPKPSYNTLLPRIGTNGDRLTVARFETCSYGLANIYSKYANDFTSTLAQDIVSEGNCVLKEDAKVTNIKGFGFSNKSVVTNCEIKIYAR